MPQLQGGFVHFISKPADRYMNKYFESLAESNGIMKEAIDDIAIACYTDIGV